MGRNIYCLFCGGPPTDKVLSPGSWAGSIITPVTEIDTSHILTAADSHFLQTVKAVFADFTTDNGTYDAGNQTLRVCEVNRRERSSLLPWRINSENPVEREHPLHFYTQYEESVGNSGDEDEESGYEPDSDSVGGRGNDDEQNGHKPHFHETFHCDPSVAHSGALAHTICLRLFNALFNEVFSETSHKPPTYRTLWDSEMRPCLQWRDDEEPEEGDGQPVQFNTLDLASARGRVSGISYGTEEQCKQDFIFVPEKVWMLARPDHFPAVPAWKDKPDPTTVCRQSALERLPVETLTLLLQTIVNGPDHPLSKGKTLLAMAGTSPWLRYHITTSNLWFHVCSQAELFPLPFVNRTPSANAVVEVINLLKAPLIKSKYDWMAYFVQAAHSPSLRNRQRIIRICEEIWGKLGYYRTPSFSDLFPTAFRNIPLGPN